MIFVILLSVVMISAVFIGGLKPHILFLFSLTWLFLSFIFLLRGDQKTAELLSTIFYLLNVLAFVYSLFKLKDTDGWTKNHGS